MLRPKLEARTQHERPHVLIVTDDESLGTFLSEGLPLGGFWTSIISSGLQALEVFNLRQFDLVVLDGDLRTFGAIEFLRRLRGKSSRDQSGRSRSAAPVVILGSEKSRPSETEATVLGISAFVAPPIELEDLVRVLHQVFAEWRTTHPDTVLADAAASRDF